MTSKQKHYVRSAFSDGAAKLGLSILQTAKQPDKIFQHGRYFGIPGDTKLQKDILERALATPKIQTLLANRPSELWPDLEQMPGRSRADAGQLATVPASVP